MEYKYSICKTKTFRTYCAMSYLFHSPDFNKTNAVNFCSYLLHKRKFFRLFTVTLHYH